MAVIPTINAPTVQPAGVGDDYMRAAAPDAAFGGGVAQAVQGLGGQTAKMGDVLAANALRMQEEANRVAADGMLNDTLTKFNDASIKYRQLEGMAAVDGFKQHAADIGAIRDEALASASNPQMRDMVRRNLEGTASRMLMGSSSYAAQQFKVGQERSSAATISNATTFAVNNQNDPVLLRAQESRVVSQATDLAKLHGLREGEETSAFVSQQVGKYWQTVLSDMATRNPQQAMAVFGKVRDRMDAASQLHIDHMMEPKFKTAIGRAFVDREMGPVEAMTLPPSTAGRASLLAAGMVKRGWTPEQASGWAANFVRESDGDPAAANGDADGGGGLGQWRGPRLEAFVKKYGKLPRNATMDEQLDFAHEEAQTTEKAAGDAVRAAKTPAEAAAILSSRFFRPKDTQGEMSRRSAIAAGMMPNAAPDAGPVTNVFPDKSAIIQKAIKQFGDDPDQLRTVISQIDQRATLIEAATATERKNIGKQFTDAVAALEAGKTDIAMPVDSIRRVFPAPQAEDMIEKLAVAKMAGQAFTSVQWAAPEDVARVRADLATGQGPLSATLRARTGAGPVTGEGETPDQFAMRQKMLARFDQMTLARREALDKDPGAYVMGSPVVQEALKSNDPQAVARSMLAVQEQLGVPEWKRHVLPAAEAVAKVGTITNMDPEKGDIGGQITALRKQYGDELWPRVWGDMVTLGKLPGAYMVLGAIDDVSARADAQRALQAVVKDGAEGLKAQAGRAKVTEIEQNIDVQLAPFLTTTAWNQGGDGLFRNVRTMTELLAYQYAARGQSGKEAVANAAKAVTGKYDFGSDYGSEWDAVRTPKGKMNAVADAAYAVRAAIDPADLMEVPGSPKLSQAERQAELATAVRRGKWVMNAGDDGIVLMMPVQGVNGTPQYIPAMRRNGVPVALKFDALPEADQAAIAARLAAQEGRAQRPQVVAPSNMATFDQ